MAAIGAVAAVTALLMVTAAGAGHPGMAPSDWQAQAMQYFSVAPTVFPADTTVDVLVGCWANVSEVFAVSAFSGRLVPANSASLTNAATVRLPTSSVRRELVTSASPKTFVYSFSVPAQNVGDHVMQLSVHFTDRFGQHGTKAFFVAPVSVTSRAAAGVAASGVDDFVVSSPPCVLDPPEVLAQEPDTPPFPAEPFLLLQKVPLSRLRVGRPVPVEVKVFNAGFEAAVDVEIHDRLDWGPIVVSSIDVDGHGQVTFPGRDTADVLGKSTHQAMEVLYRWPLLEPQEWVSATVYCIPMQQGLVRSKPARVTYAVERFGGTRSKLTMDSTGLGAVVVEALHGSEL